MPDLFSPAGIAEWRTRLEHSSTFRDAAGSWTGTVLLVSRDDAGDERFTFVAVTDGRIDAARPATSADQDEAEFVLAASPATWQGLISGQIELVAAAMGGRLKLERGNVLRLIAHARGARELLREAADGS